MNVLKIIIVFFASILICFSCKKNNHIKYYGEVTSQPNYCSSITGYPFIIYYQKDAYIDSFITATLLAQFKILHTKIIFEMREINNSDASIACTGPFTFPKQLVIII